ncbi:hypothetical protein [Phreatobacter sp.]|uniref:hypothetical protein n=1 Tax=Phreatobacter sp. TaxID=1966341 RepID=UPI003F722E7C
MADAAAGGAGFLAIWSDVTVDRETDYLHWLAREHTAERLGVEGFLSVRVFRALAVDARRYFILYRLASPEVLASPAYLARLNEPTPWSRRMMPILGHFVRGGGRSVARAGLGQGGFVAAARLDTVPAGDAQALVSAAVANDRVAAAELLVTDSDRSAIDTREKGMRAGDASFAALLLVEGLDAEAARSGLEKTGPGGSAGLYAQVFRLGP